ncbi:hypothetical protein CH304_02715 [Rhodococcus sp. 15-649-1-2]|nr:HAMP domain-containing sensor histidine kinase [Rhodococcus sp. 15-649-1-2]OZE87124.1 hypothetical protein CH304_02715 [Rhodococcus sp. 15-649-1-2]
MTRTGTGLRTASLRRRLVISTIVAVILVLGAAVAATEILVGAQLKATATAQLDDRVQRARSIHDTGADPAAVVTAAQGGGTTARLVTTDGRTYGNPDLDAEAPTPDPPQPGDPAAPPAAPLQPPGPPPSGTDSESVTTQLSDGSLLTVAVDTAAISDVRDQLRSVLVAVFLVALVLVGLVVVIIVRTSLRPLHHMTVLARRIASGARGDRLDPDRTNTEIGSAAAAFDQMLDSVEAAERRERATSARTRQFFDDAAHELRTPIAGIRAAAETLIRAGADADANVREELEVLLVRESGRAARLVDDLLSLARIDEGVVVDRRPVDLDALVAADIERLSVAAPGRTIEAHGRKGVVAEGDPLRLAQILANLTNNAVAYSPHDEPVSITISHTVHDIRLAVRDNGIGIPAGERERVFERLVRLDRARTIGSGSGLGLSIARDLARAHGGELECHGNGPENGSTFVLLLPRGLVTTSAPSRASQHRVASPQQAGRRALG